MIFPSMAWVLFAFPGLSFGHQQRAMSLPNLRMQENARGRARSCYGSTEHDGNVDFWVHNGTSRQS